MAYTQKILKTETREINLRDIPFTEWPQEAKNAAEYFLRQRGREDKIRQDLFRLELMAVWVEDYLNTPFENFL
mgnify:CR=1 FL=1